jgi:hypothetical protein
MKLKITDKQRAAKQSFSSLSTDGEGNEILVGLTFEESGWFLDYQDRRLKPRRDDRAHEDKLRYLELASRHDFARVQVLGAVYEAKQKPTWH